jgi:hypothetical protein
MEESGDLIRRISVFANTTNIDPKRCNGFLDELMMSEQKFDHLKAQITSQAQRFARATVTALLQLEQSFGEQQDVLRSKMYSTEKNFARTKNACSFFLFSYLNDSLQKTEKSPRTIARNVTMK